MSVLQFGRSDPRWLILILVLSALAAAALALVAWFAMPLIAFGGAYPFADPSPRLAAVLVIVVAWGVLNALLRAGRNSADQARLDALDRQEVEARAQRDGAELAREEAFSRLRLHARRMLRPRSSTNFWLGGSDVRPRYLVVGPTGSGKSSALAAADLNLPFEALPLESDETDPGCRFLPSDGALYLDVAGDLLYGTRPEWVGLWPRLLDLIRAGRPARPVDGVILVVAVTDLAEAAEDVRTGIARSLRARLDEIAYRLRVGVPVYVLLSKVDRVPGFSEFFEPLGAEERKQLWGIPLGTLDKTAPGGATRAGFCCAFDDLVRRAVARELNLLHTEPDAERRTLAFEFPAQFASLRDRVADFLMQLARQNQVDGAPRLRGLFLVSSSQDGDVVDAIGTEMALTFAMQSTLRAAGHALAKSARPRAYFLERLLGDIIPSEAGSGHLSRRAHLTARVRLLGARAAAAGVLVALALAAWTSYGEANAYIARVVTRADGAVANVARLPLQTAASPNFPATLATLATLDDLASLVAATAAPAPDVFVDRPQVRAAASAAYADGLRTLLVPLIMRSLEARLADVQTPPAVTFDCLKLYLLVGGGRPPPAPLLAELGPSLAGDWLGVDADAAAIQRAVDQIATLADVAMPAQPTDGALVAQAHRRLVGITVPQIAYEILRQQPSIRALKPWRPIDHAGGLGPRVIARASGPPLTDGIQGLFTTAGLQEVGTAAASIADAFAGDAWVFGPDAVDQPNLSARAIRTGVLDLYRADYVRVWEGLLTDLTVPPMPTAAAAADVFAILYGANDPVQQLLSAVVAETSPDADVGDAVLQNVGHQSAASSLASAAGSQIGTALSQRTSLAGLTASPRQIIARQFMGLREAVARAKDGQDSDVEAALRSLDPLYRQLLLASTGNAQPDQPSGGPNAALVQVALKRLPISIRPYFERLAADATGLLKTDVRGRAAGVWAATARPVCRAIIDKAFPFDLKGARAVTLAEFAQLFSPNGIIASFRRTQLGDLIDTGARPWRWRDGRIQPLDRPDPTLAMFERADAITAAFFAEGDHPQVRFTLETVRLDPKVESLQFDVGGASLRYAHGPEVPFIAQWPPSNADAPATLSLRPEVDGKLNSLVGEGPWGLFRLLAQGRSSPSGEGLLFAFDIGGRRASLKITVPTLKNPFDMRQLTAFRCPEF